MSRHPGISMHKLPVGGDIMGTVFALGIVLMFVVGTPLARWFLLGAVVLGGFCAVVFVRYHQKHEVEITDLSGLDGGEDRSR